MKRLVIFIFSLVLLLNTFSVKAQQGDELQNRQIEQLTETLASQSDGTADVTNQLDEMALLQMKKIDLNKADVSSMVNSGLITGVQAAEIVKHRQVSGLFLNVYELQTLDGFTKDDFYRLFDKVTTGVNFDTIPSFKTMLNDGLHRAILRSARYFPTSKGYTQPSTTNSRYLGDPYEMYFRYRFDYNDKVSYGIIAVKNAGEPFGGEHNPAGFDMYGGYLSINKIGHLRKLIIGDYRLGYGQGLLVWQDIAFGKSPFVNMVAKVNSGGNTSLSTYAYRRFRGLFSSWQTGNLGADVFVSMDKRDGSSVNIVDSVSGDYAAISSINNSELHRTPAEIANKNSTGLKVAGTNLSYRTDAQHASVTLLGGLWDYPIMPSPQPYNKFYFRGQNFAGFSGDYKRFFNGGLLFAEYARYVGHEDAYIGGITICPDQKLTLTALYRKYSADYPALFSNAFGENSQTSNEQGFYMSAELKLNPKNKLSAFADMYRVPWLSYTANGDYGGSDYFFQWIYTPSKPLELALNYRIKTESQTASLQTGEHVASLQPVRKENLRLNILYKITRAITLRTRAEFCTLNSTGKPDKGFLMFQDFSWKPFGSNLSFVVRYAVFDTDSYDSRIYATENNVAYYVYFPAYYYKGSKTCLTVHYRIAKGLGAWLHVSKLVYDGAKTVGSGLDEIEGPNKYLVRAQLTWDFSAKEARF